MWWRVFFVLPLSEKIGFQNALNLSLEEAFYYKDAMSERGEIEEYYYWYSDYKREQEKKRDGEKPNMFGKREPKDKMDLLMGAERNQQKVQHAMESADNYFALMQERGFTAPATTKVNNGLKR